MRKRRLSAVCILIFSAFVLCCVFEKSNNSIMKTFHVDATTKKEIMDEMVIALFIKEITEEVTDFYSDYYLGDIEVYNYEVTIVNIEKREPGFILIEFGVTPQIGAHNPLGYDEVSYLVDSIGNKKLADYEHLKNYEVPEKFQDNLVKPFR